MQKILFPGSFDPPTKAHIDIIQRLVALNYEVYIGVLNNNAKIYYFPIKSRVQILELEIKALKNCQVITANELLVNVCQQYNITVIARGLRNMQDYEYEKIMEVNNKILSNKLEYIYLNTKPKYQHISSSVVKELLKYDNDISHLVGKKTNKYILSLQK